MNGYRLDGVERPALLEHGRWVYGYGMEDALILSPPKPAKATLLELAKAACAVASAVAITFLANLLSNKFERWQPKRKPEPKPEPQPVVPIIIEPPTMRPGRSHAADVYDGSTCINASHASSAMDIVLGSFRYAINERSKPTARLLMRQIAPMMWGEHDGTSMNVFERGLIMRPQRKSIVVASYGTKYDDLTTYFNDLVEAL